MNLRDRNYFVQRVHPGVATFLGVYSVANEFFREVREGNYILFVGTQVLRQQGLLCCSRQERDGKLRWCQGAGLHAAYQGLPEGTMF